MSHTLCHIYNKGKAIVFIGLKSMLILQVRIHCTSLARTTLCVKVSFSPQMWTCSFCQSHVATAERGKKGPPPGFMVGNRASPDLGCICMLLLLPCRAQSCPTLCNPIHCRPPGSPVHRISRQEYWSGLSFPSPGDLPNPEMEPVSPEPLAFQADSLPAEPLGKSLG